MKPAILLSFLGLAAAVPWNPSPDRLLPRKDEKNQPAKDQPEDQPAQGKKRLLVSAVGAIIAVDFDPNTNEFKPVTHTNDLGGSNPSWLQYSSPNTIYAFDEFGTKVFIFDYNPSKGGEIGKVKEILDEGAWGVVHLELSHDGNRMLASSYTNGTIQVWNTEDKRNIFPLDTLDSGGDLGPNQDSRRVHQVVKYPDESSNLFVANDLGSDSLIVIDGTDPAKYTTKGNFSVEVGCAPRHGVFHGKDAKSRYYTVVCEGSNLLLTYKTEIPAEKNNITFTFQQAISTFNPRNPPLNMSTVAAGAVIIDDKKNHLYVSNRKTGHPTDFISVFDIDGGSLKYRTEFSSKAKNPRMMSLSSDKNYLFVANMENAKGLHAFKWENSDFMNMTKVAYADLTSEIKAEGEDTGPSYVREVFAASEPSN